MGTGEFVCGNLLVCFQHSDHDDICCGMSVLQDRKTFKRIICGSASRKVRNDRIFGIIVRNTVPAARCIPLFLGQIIYWRPDVLLTLFPGLDSIGHSQYKIAAQISCCK